MKGATMGTKQTQAAFTPGPMGLTVGGSTVDLHLARSAGDTSAKTRVLRMSRAGDWIEAEIRSRAHDIEADDPPLARLRAALRQARGEA